MNPTQGRRVLVICSGLGIGQLIAEILSIDRGDEVKVAHEVTTCQLIVQEWFPDLVICEPDSLKSYQRSCQVPGLENTPIILALNMPLKEASDRCLRQGVSGYLFHPFSADELIAAHDAVLRGKTYYPWEAD